MGFLGYLSLTLAGILLAYKRLLILWLATDSRITCLICNNIRNKWACLCRFSYVWALTSAQEVFRGRRKRIRWRWGGKGGWRRRRRKMKDFSKVKPQTNKREILLFTTTDCKPPTHTCTQTSTILTIAANWTEGGCWSHFLNMDSKPRPWCQLLKTTANEDELTHRF